MEFTIFQITDNQALNYFFTFPIYVMFTTLPFIAILSIFKKI
jgi:hypothetical protein